MTIVIAIPPRTNRATRFIIRPTLELSHDVCQDGSRSITNGILLLHQEQSVTSTRCDCEGRWLVRLVGPLVLSANATAHAVTLLGGKPSHRYRASIPNRSFALKTIRPP